MAGLDKEGNLSKIPRLSGIGGSGTSSKHYSSSMKKYAPFGKPGSVRSSRSRLSERSDHNLRGLEKGRNAFGNKPGSMRVKSSHFFNSSETSGGPMEITDSGQNSRNFKLHLIKYQRDLDKHRASTTNLENKRACLVEMRDQLAKNVTASEMPEIPQLPLLDSEALQEIENLRLENSRLSKEIEESTNRFTKSSDCLVKLESELPKIESSYSTMLEIMGNAESKQNFIEQNLEAVKNEINRILTCLKSIATSPCGIDFSTTEFDGVRNQFEIEKERLLAELISKNNEISDLKNFISNEKIEKENLEMNLIQLNNEKKGIQENCQGLIDQMEKLKEMHQLVRFEGIDAGADFNNEMLLKKYEDVQIQLLDAQRQLKTMINENDGYKRQIEIMMKNNENLLSDLEKVCHQCLFEKENQIYNMKCKMNEIVNLKNVFNCEDSRPFDLEAAMCITDVKTLKAEVVRFHKRWIDSVESKNKTEAELTAKDDRVNNLNEETKNLNEMIRRLENLIKSLKARDKQNAQNINYLQNALSMRMGDEVHTNENVNDMLQKVGNRQDLNGPQTLSQMMNLLSTVERYKMNLAGMERRLFDLEAVHRRCAEKRTRNERRIALLEIDLAKYE